VAVAEEEAGVAEGAEEEAGVAVAEGVAGVAGSMEEG